MDCSPKALIDLATCTDSCVPPGLMAASQIASACAWTNGGALPCTLPIAPIDLGVVTGDGQVTLIWPAGVGATGYNIKRALVPGGPYTVIGTSAASPYVDHTVVNYTTYYYVVSSTNVCGESAGNSIESHATPFNIVVSGWRNRVQTNGGAAPSMNTTTALDVFVNSLKACAIDSLMITVNCFVPDSLIAALTPLYVFGNDPWTNQGPFVAGDLTVDGLIGDGATKSLDTGMIPSNYNNFFAGAGGWYKYGVTVYNFTSNIVNESEFGCLDASGFNNAFVLAVSGPLNAAFYCPGGPGGGLGVLGANAGWTGYTSGNCIKYGTTEGSHEAELYKSNSVFPHAQFGSNVVNDLAIDNEAIPVFCFAYNNNGSAIGRSTKRISFAAIHQGLTEAQSLCFYNAIQAFRVALGGGFV